MFDVGAGCSQIDLTYPLPLAGYQARTEMASTTHDPLFVRVLIVEGRSGCVAVVALDVLYADSGFAGAVRASVHAATSIDPSAVMVCSTHTHSGPGLIFPDSNRCDSSNTQSILASVTSAASKASDSRTACELMYAAGTASGIASRRSGTAGEVGPVDQGLSVAEFRSSERGLAGSPKFAARVINFACHPTILGPDNLLISRDWPGYLVDTCEDDMRHAGVQHPFAMFLNGAAADLSTRYTRKAQSFEEAQRMGRQLSSRASELLTAASRSCTYDVCMQHEVIGLTHRDLPSEEQAIAAAEEADLEAGLLAQRGASPLMVKKARDMAAAWRIVLKRVRSQDSGARGPVSAEMCLVGMGDLAMVFIPGEVPSDTGDRVRMAVVKNARVAEERVWVVGYSNGHFGYLAQQRAGPDGYEEVMCDLAPEATEQILTTVATLSSKRMCIDQC